MHIVVKLLDFVSESVQSFFYCGQRVLVFHCRRPLCCFRVDLSERVIGHHVLCVTGHGGEVQFVLGPEDHVLGADFQDSRRQQGRGNGEEGELRRGRAPLAVAWLAAMTVEELESALDVQRLRRNGFNGVSVSLAHQEDGGHKCVLCAFSQSSSVVFTQLANVKKQIHRRGDHQPSGVQGRPFSWSHDQVSGSFVRG